LDTAAATARDLRCLARRGPARPRPLEDCPAKSLDGRPGWPCPSGRDIGLTLRQQDLEVERAQRSLEHGRVEQDDVRTPIDGDDHRSARPVELGEDVSDPFLELRD
jgi:hypothetical protein